jgi:heme iron utilization protein
MESMSKGQVDMAMKDQAAIRADIGGILDDNRFAVLATEGDGQPHASLVAITPIEGYRQLIFATDRNTLKYRNLAHNGKVAVLIEGGNANRRLEERVVLTAFGQAAEFGIAEPGYEGALRAHLERHPDLESFLRSTDCALIRVLVSAYQIVHGIDDVKWWTIDDRSPT